MASQEVVVALALGIPSLLVAAISLWIAFLTYTHSRPAPLLRRSRTPSWPEQHQPTFDAGNGSLFHGANGPIFPPPAFSGESLRRRL
ncbi:hypothetical protein PG999_010234 [Apiospora kogelbergensis]|uniref:Uncharacterized protein n=1 Tax=Apiospora kogelbergensis TaxID=1337665 RepID=A0AAW0QB24_9PEZI